MAPIYTGPTPDNLTQIPHELQLRPQWVLWRGVDRIDQQTGMIKLNKIPINPYTLLPADSTDPSTWGDFTRCVDALPSALEEWEIENPGAYRGGGIGYVFTDDDPYVGIDFDACVDAITGEIASWAQEHLARFQTYAEITPSGTGLHILAEGTLPPKGRKKGTVEMYSYARFFTMTGWHLDETPPTIEPCPGAIAVLWCSLFAPNIGDAVWTVDEHDVICNPAPWIIHGITLLPAGPYATFQECASGWPLIQCQPAPTTENTPHPSLFDDDAIIKKATSAANGEKVKRLAAGQWQQDYASQSEADLGFCCEITFYTQDPDQLDRLFRTTGLLRPKWDERRGTMTYGRRTVLEAIARTTEHYWTGELEVSPPPVSSAPTTSSPARQLTASSIWGVPKPVYTFDVMASMSSEELLKLMLVPPRFLVEKLVPDGLTILGAPAKSYKSFFSLSLALATIGVGDWCDTFPVESQGDVVFFGLEAPWEQLRRRMFQLHPEYRTGQTPHKIHFFSGMTCLPSAKEGLHDAIAATIVHFKPRLIVIDPLSYLYRMGRNDDLVTATLSLLWPLADLAVKNQVAIFAPEHMRKRSANDVSIIDTLGGSHIKPAVAHAVLMLERQDEELVINSTMRDAASQDLAFTLEFDADDHLVWGYKGASNFLTRDTTHSKLRLAITDALQTGGVPLTIDDFLIVTGLPDTRQNRQIIARILDRCIKDREVARISRGTYTWIGGK